ncbi:MAG: RsiV family protein [Bacillota bacterium]|jgi:hypothetical protein
MNDRDFDKLLKNSLRSEESPSCLLDERVKKKMKQANRNSNKFLKYGKYVASVAVCALLAVTVLANSSQTVALAMQEVPVLGAITKAVTFRTYEDVEKDFAAYVEVPRIDGLGSVTDELNAEIRAYTDSIIAMYEDDKSSSGGEGKYALDSGYETLTDNEDYYSIKVWTTISMADTNEFNKYYTVDKKAGKIIGLADLFADGYDYKEAVSEEILRQMRAAMAADADLTYFIDGGFDDFKTIAEDQNFYMDQDNNLVISFDKYTVAPGYMGVQQFTVGKIVDGKLAAGK